MFGAKSTIATYQIHGGIVERSQFNINAVHMLKTYFLNDKYFRYSFRVFVLTF